MSQTYVGDNGKLRRGYFKLSACVKHLWRQVAYHLVCVIAGKKSSGEIEYPTVCSGKTTQSIASLQDKLRWTAMLGKPQTN